MNQDDAPLSLSLHNWIYFILFISSSHSQQVSTHKRHVYSTSPHDDGHTRNLLLRTRTDTKCIEYRYVPSQEPADRSSKFESRKISISACSLLRYCSNQRSPSTTAIVSCCLVNAAVSRARVVSTKIMYHQQQQQQQQQQQRICLHPTRNETRPPERERESMWLYCTTSSA